MDKNFNIKEDKSQFQKEQDELLKVVLSERYFKPWSLSPSNKTISSVPAGHLEIYITSQGNRYHTQLNCSGLKRTIYTVPLSQTGGRGRCSKCG